MPAIPGASNTSPIVITTDGDHNLVNNQTVLINGCRGNTGANGTWVITVLSANTFELTVRSTGGTSTGNGEYVANSGAYISINRIVNATAATPIVVTTEFNHNLAGGDIVVISDVLGNTAANGVFAITVLTDTTFELIGSEGNASFIDNAPDNVVSVPDIPILINDAIIDSNNIVTLETLYDHNLIDDATIQLDVNSIQGISGINGIWPYQVVDETHIKLLGFIAPTDAVFVEEATAFKSNPTALTNISGCCTTNQITDVQLEVSNPLTVTAPNHNLTNDQIVEISGVVFVGEDVGVNGRHRVTVVDSDEFTIIPIPNTSSTPKTINPDVSVKVSLHPEDDYWYEISLSAGSIDITIDGTTDATITGYDTSLTQLFTTSTATNYTLAAAATILIKVHSNDTVSAITFNFIIET